MAPHGDEALIERTGAPTELLVERDFATLITGRETHRYDMYDVRPREEDGALSPDASRTLPERRLADRRRYTVRLGRTTVRRVAADCRAQHPRGRRVLHPTPTAITSTSGESATPGREYPALQCPSSPRSRGEVARVRAASRRSPMRTYSKKTDRYISRARR